jgi:hypothetical protein
MLLYADEDFDAALVGMTPGWWHLRINRPP